MIVAAVASVPAMLLTMAGGHAATVGTVVNVLTVIVFVAETVVLLALSGDRIRWIRRHRFPVIVSLASIPAVVFAVGPVQVLRLLRMVRVIGALRILRVSRIVRAGRVLRRRAGLDGWAWRLTFLALSLVAAGFVGVVLADPSSTSRQALDAAVGRFGFLLVPIAGTVVAGATYTLLRYRRRSEPSDPG